ncbi:MAG TPA: riboflavin kinase, partial [Cytophagales bacterium]|nr:riboflavin kinase [Cytophagales bacterium]
IIGTIGTQTLLLGHDHRFGKNREGSFAYLKENESKFGIEVFEISRLDIDAAAVSSTRIREYIHAGNMPAAAALLGRYYSVYGTVISGKKLGRTIGYPTANIRVSNAQKLLPKLGVYAVAVELEQVYYGGMLSIGYNPTVSDSDTIHVEVHIFDFNSDIYDKELTIQFLKRLRDELKFGSLEELKTQLHQDALDSKHIYTTYLQQTISTDQ